ncbi:MAG: molybdenum cofactor cytidylyltransferase, partial [Conexibacter sp.]|nr:molybdenum cofactor cytidylyltransferase [Conexibacter sp.]
MAGGPSTPELAAAVSGAGGLGFLAAGYKSVEEVRADVEATRALTDRPFGVNVFGGGGTPADPVLVAAYAARLRAEAVGAGVALGEPRFDDDQLSGKLELLAELGVAGVSFTFALPSREAVERLRAAGIRTVVTARLEAEDVGEDEAAGRLAQAVAADGVRVERPFTGRSNLFAREAGILVVDAAVINAVNAVDEAVTLATLPAFKPVVAGEMVGTVKIIPYGVAGAVLDRALARVSGGGAVRVAPYCVSRVGVVSTLTPALKPTVVAKTLAALGDRLAPAGAAVVAAVSCPHDQEALRAELARLAAGEAELVVVFG